MENHLQNLTGSLSTLIENVAAIAATSKQIQGEAGPSAQGPSGVVGVAASLPTASAPTSRAPKPSRNASDSEDDVFASPTPRFAPDALMAEHRRTFGRSGSKKRKRKPRSVNQRDRLFKAARRKPRLRVR